ncbi:MAG: TIGR03960 family B12-binding radical SAM protein [Candidatus Cloacimonetes bacterium]|nr:TIGR03960 family B12-binding radical SAM protein [Candidatus Cloacimonadota bacterium]
MKKVDIEHLLSLVEKPSRYINHEINACNKDYYAAEVRFAFAFPEVYELGISHLGIKILYSIINKLDFAMADRVYLPWTDLADLMRAENKPLFGWESRLAVMAFDVLGITLQSELNFTNVLELIDLAGIPLHSTKREEDCPIVMAGGPCATNPLPLAPFIDVFYLGEAEIGIVQIANILRKYKSRKERLQHLAELESCFVPALHGTNPKDGFVVHSRKYNEFHTSENCHEPQLLSWQLATHNRYVAEIMRGCSRGCRFCHAGYFYRPVRERTPEQILQDLLTEINTSGWDEAGLVSLSSSDYSCIQELLIGLLNSVDTQKTHISLPSLRVDSLNDALVDVMKSLGREGLTIAPEAGSQRLREVINKNLSEADILNGVQVALKLGWQKIKLYFMLGLPTEDQSDIDGIVELIDKINAMGKKRLQINVTLSPFVPKPFTPFQWCGMLQRETLIFRAQYIKNTFARTRNVKIRYHTVESSILEAALTRGDSKMSAVLEAAWKQGARFDGWNECFNFSLWETAFQETNTNISDYLQERSVDESLPWDFVDTGVCKEFFVAEYRKAQQGIQTKDCKDLCTLCGVCEGEVQTHRARQETSQTEHVQVINPAVVTTDEQESCAPPKPLESQRKQYRYRVHYQKVGMLRFISHLDWMRMLFRRIAILELETVFTQGFNPHPKVSLSPPLPVGVEGTSEFFDISFYSPYTPEVILAEFRRTRIPDFNLTECELIAGKGSIPFGEVVVVTLEGGMEDSCKECISQFHKQAEFIYTKSTPTRQKSYDLKKIISRVELQGNELHIEKLLESPALFDVLSAILNYDKKLLYRLPIVRTGLIAKDAE